LAKDAVANLADGGDPYEDWPEDEESGDTEKPEVALKIASDVREAANALFKKGDTAGAFAKYQSMFSFYTLDQISRYLTSAS
jgi:peptidyl-prolyl isomerase D